MEAFTVSMLNRYVKLKLETDDVLTNLWVTGEISNFAVNGFSGHMYFTLKDEASSVKAVCFKSAAGRLRFLPKSGMEVLVLGRAGLFERDGQFQIIVEDILPRGDGAQNKFLEELRNRLSREGLFDEYRKRTPAKFPQSIAVITAKDSAALSDIVKVISRRYPMTKLVVFPVYVQGYRAEGSIVKAIETVNETGGFDTVIIARGGGSGEDLFAFNSEEVVRAAVRLSAPFISAIGHERDMSLLDLAADVRASTPSAAAELAVPDISVLKTRLNIARNTVAGRAGTIAGNRRTVLRDLGARCETLSRDAVERQAVRVNNYKFAVKSLASGRLMELKAKVLRFTGVIGALNPRNVMERGYSYAEKDGNPVVTVKSLKRKDKISLFFKDGRADCFVENVSKRIMHG